MERPRFNLRKRAFPILAIGLASAGGMAIATEVHAKDSAPIDPIIRTTPIPRHMKDGITYDLTPYAEQKIDKPNKENPINQTESVLIALAAGVVFGALASGHTNREIHKRTMHSDPKGEHVAKHHHDYKIAHYLKSNFNMESVISFSNIYRAKLLAGASVAAAAIGLTAYELPFANLSALTAIGLGAGALIGQIIYLGGYEFYHISTHDQGFLRSYINLILGELLQEMTQLKEVKIAFPTLVDLDTLIEKAIKSGEKAFNSKKSLSLLKEFTEQIQQYQKNPELPKFNLEDAKIMILKVAKQVSDQEALAKSQGYGKFKDLRDRVLTYMAHKAPIISELQAEASYHHELHHVDQGKNFTNVIFLADDMAGSKLKSSREDLIKNKRSWITIAGFVKGRYGVQAKENPNEPKQSPLQSISVYS